MQARNTGIKPKREGKVTKIFTKNPGIKTERRGKGMEDNTTTHKEHRDENRKGREDNTHIQRTREPKSEGRGGQGGRRPKMNRPIK